MTGDNRWRDRRDFRRATKKQKLVRSAEEELESKLGFELFTEGDKRLGWLLTFAPSSWEDQETRRVHSCVDLYFVTQEGSYFKAKYKFRPYFYAATKEKMEMDVEAYLRRRYETQIANIEIVDKEDLDLKNHLSGLRKPFLKVSFDTVEQLMNVKKDLLHVVQRNQVKFEAMEAYESVSLTGKREHRHQDFLDCIVDLREYDVPYHVRFAIDNDIRCGQWYDVHVSSINLVLDRRTDLLQRAEVHVCAFDIETTKLPLKFPDAEYDLVMMISYMVDGQGYLIINRECVGEDIEDLEYTPKPEFEGCFKVTNVQNEVELLRHWFAHMHDVKPGIYVTYNGDYFDWPFLESRAAFHGLKMTDEVGFSCDKNQGECRAKFACHLDCFAWVKRDSYLPQGSQGLKAVTKAKLGYDPLEVNPEDMVRFAKEKPQMMASYSVSDAVATYYLYMTYVHPFIFSLATIIPMSPDEVLRKGSGTLCEMLLMVQAYKANVICPNKHQSDDEKFHKGHLLESETYIGGHVECLESGVFRSDIPTSFKLDPSAYDQLLHNLDRDLQYAIRVEGKMELDSVVNYDEVKTAIEEKLLILRDQPIREECPLIYHLDVAAMYPNIILTNRLQPSSVVTDDICTACDFNRPDKNCLRKLEWVWRGDIFMAKKSDYYHLKKQIESEFVEGTDGQLSRSFLDLPKLEQQSKLKERLKKYCQKAYKRVIDKPVTELREAGICMRENSFYIDTVRSFRDRRYEYKGLNKVWKGKLSEAKASGNSIKIQEAQDLVVLYDSLQLAHKCILNSFYGYVMRKGARWYSMEMAGVVTYTGAKIIQNARLLIDKIGKPLELDTDGIWCTLPGSFPENFTFKTKDMKKLTISYPCVMLNVDVARNNTNDQYQTLVDPVNKVYETHSECSIEFEVDGPYKAMIIPASKEEGILIKKRYAVFNDDGTLAELKGFEIKRRGELKLIKVFQAELFDKFLDGSNLEECYSAVAAVANRWLDLLDNKGRDVADSELLDYISESSTMSKSLAEYGEQKSCAVTTARRLADFLGGTMVKDKGLRCQYIVACEPRGTPVSERAVPVAIFETDAEIMKFYLRKWCKTASNVDIRSIIDWSYYKQRLGSSIQKIITIPAAMQKVANPVPRVAHPDWLHKKVHEKEDKFRQRKLADIFSSLKSRHPLGTESGALTDDATLEKVVEDLEDFGNKATSTSGPVAIVRSLQTNDRQDSVEKTDRVDSLQLPASLCGNKDDQISMEQINTCSTKTIDRNEDYQGWLELKKRKWKENLDRRKRQRLGNLRNSNHAIGTSKQPERLTSKGGRHRNGVGSYFTAHEVALTRSHWQILQIVPNVCCGHFLAWVVVDGIMLKIPVEVPRVFYLNSREPITEKFPGRCVTKVLPRAKRSYNLVEVIINEDKFREEKKKLGALLADPEVEGSEVWVGIRRYWWFDTMTLWDDFLLSTSKCLAPMTWLTNPMGLRGCLRKKFLGKVYDYSWTKYTDRIDREIAMKPRQICYPSHRCQGIYETQLPLEFSAILQIGCVCKVDKTAKKRTAQDGWKLSELHMKTTTECPYLDQSLPFFYLYHSISEVRALFVAYLAPLRIVNVVMVNPYQNKDLSTALLERQFQQACNALSVEPPRSGLAFKLEYVGSVKEAETHIQGAISELRAKQQGPIIAVIECPNANVIKSGIPVLDNFPCMTIPANARDSHYQVLGWQQVAARMGMQRCAASSQWLQERISLSRYAHVPLGNLDPDWLVFTADVFFSRALRDQQMVLWASNDGIPDLGGFNDDFTIFSDEDYQPVLIYPGAYRKVSVELKIHHLAVNALLKSNQVNEMEGGAFLGSDDVYSGANMSAEQCCLDETTSSSPALRVLKQLVHRCLADAVKSGNVFADAMLQHLYRWLCSSQSKLHDPALHRTLQKVMRKVFALLLAEIRKLGGTIIFANFSKVIIDTGKLSLSVARTYSDSLLKALQARELFEWIELEQVQFWHTLLFMDQYNYGGIPAKTDDVLHTESEVDQLHTEQPQGDTVYSWKIAEYLPKNIQDHFVIIVSEFLFIPWDYARKQDASRASFQCTPSITISVAEAFDSQLVEYLKKKINEDFTDKLIGIIRDTVCHLEGIKKSDTAASQPAPNVQKGDPAVEFIKHVCAVLALDRNVQHEVLVMRKNLLKYVRVREFAPEAIFQDHCSSFILPNVICSYCNDCRDLDLCRDSSLLSEEWRCAVPQCGQPYDREVMENALLQIVRRRERLYHLQDLVCLRCKQVKAAHLADQCACAGSYRCREDASDFRSKMQIFMDVASPQKFELLQQCTSWILEAQ